MSDNQKPTEQDINAPIAWQVSAILSPDRVSAQKPAPEFSQCATKAAAEAYRDELKAKGYIATVTPIYMSKGSRTKARNKTQMRTAPKKFTKDWRLHDGG